MPSVATKRSAPRKTAKRSQPYDRSKRTKARDASYVSSPVATPTPCKEIPTTSPSPALNVPTGSPVTPVPHTVRLKPTMREICSRAVRKRFPSYTLRNDWELLQLSGGAYKGGESGIREYLDRTLVSRVKEFGSHERVMSNATTVLNERVECTGMKPDPDDPDVFVQALPDSDYSVRLFPGSLQNSEYCLDFVHSRTGEPVNSPFKFDLICVPDPNAPIGSGPVYRMRPLECAFGIEANEIRPGSEKFLFRDGQHCVLRRPGLRDVRFTIPIRRRPQAVLPTPDAHFLQFPQHIG
ncbi:hypothetical protein C8Q78DRAFT_1033965 [Trametes maxima]|nr:hypothetical protein C8Q78DRAFT_1033965 [Trametes maxima]